MSTTKNSPPSSSPPTEDGSSSTAEATATAEPTEAPSSLLSDYLTGGYYKGEGQKRYPAPTLVDQAEEIGKALTEAKNMALDAALNEVSNGNMTGTVLNDANGQAAGAVAEMEKLLGGATYAANEQSVYVDYVKVTPDNVGDFMK